MRRPVRRIALVTALSALAVVCAPAPGFGQAPGEKYALLIGVRQYDPNELRVLPYAEPDVTELGRVLQDVQYRQVVTLSQTAGAANYRLLPTAANIRTTLKGILEDRNPVDTVVVALAGHGVQFRDSPDSFFCPMDARLSDRSTLVSLDEVYRELERSPAGVKLLLVDACRNDPQSDNARSRATVRLQSVTRPQEQRPPGGVAALFSCSPGERAFEHDKLKHGVFYHYVIQGLSGEADFDRDGTVGVEELALFTKRRVPDFVKEEYGFDVRQMPVLRGEVGGLGALTRPANRPAAATRVGPLFSDQVKAGSLWRGWLTQEGRPGSADFSVSIVSRVGKVVEGVVRFRFKPGAGIDASPCAIRFKGEVEGQVMNFTTYSPLEGRPTYPAHYRGEFAAGRFRGDVRIPTWGQKGRFDVQVE